jgi:hypothetical protein
MARSPRKNTIIALWLLPREPVATVCRQTVERLAQQYDAPIFLPHLTLGVVDKVPRPFQESLSTPIVLRAGGVFSSALFTQTLFIRFRISPALAALRHLLGLGGEYDPHLSLLYQNLSTDERATLTASLKLPFAEVEFDRVVAVRCANPTTGRADIEAWQMLLRDI